MTIEQHLKHRGGLTTFKHARGDIHRWLHEDSSGNARFTTMFDLYGLPADFPRYAAAAKVSDPYERIEILETALSEAIGDRRFIPHIGVNDEACARPKVLGCETRWDKAGRMRDTPSPTRPSGLDGERKRFRHTVP